MTDKTKWITKLAAAGFFVAAAVLGFFWQQTSTPQAVLAQSGSVANHAIPIGKGPGVTGFGAAAPGAAGTVLTSTGTGSDPAFSNPPSSSVANHAVAIGTGGVGLNGAAPGTSGFVMTSNGGSSDPSFQALPTYPTVPSFASAAQYMAGVSSNTIIPPSIVYQAEVPVTFSATPTFDFSTFLNASITLTGNITTQTLSNVKAGQAGTITFIQDATGGRTTVWNSVFKFAGGTTPTLSTGANKVDVLTYSCRSATFCVASLVADVR
jgi:hypothetical protein